MEQKNDFEERIGEDLRRYLLAQGFIDERMPECPDVEDIRAGFNRSLCF